MAFIIHLKAFVQTYRQAFLLPYFLVYTEIHQVTLSLVCTKYIFWQNHQIFSSWVVDPYKPFWQLIFIRRYGPLAGPIFFLYSTAPLRIFPLPWCSTSHCSQAPGRVEVNSVFPFLLLIDMTYIRLAYAKPCAKASAACRVASAKALFEKRFRKASESWLFELCFRTPGFLDLCLRLVASVATVCLTYCKFL